MIRSLVRDALRRERRFTQAELTAYDYASRCAQVRERWAKHGATWRCTPDWPCTFCEWIRTL